MLTIRDIAILSALADYYCLNRAQIQRLCFPEDTTGRITRRHLLKLLQDTFLSRHSLFAFSPLLGAPSPVYYPSRKGNEFLAAHLDDERYFLTCTQPPQPSNLLHWLAISDTHITISEAIAHQQEVELLSWLNEWDIANKDESQPEKRFRLYTLLTRQPRLVCAPDAAFLLSLKGHRKVYYVEQDRETSGIRQIAASKSPGYAALAEHFLHWRHFPETNVERFSVLLVTTTQHRRDALRKAFHSRPGAHLWRFAAKTDLTADTFLHEPIFYRCDGEPTTIVRRETVSC